MDLLTLLVRWCLQNPSLLWFMNLSCKLFQALQAKSDLFPSSSHQRNESKNQHGFNHKPLQLWKTDRIFCTATLPPCYLYYLTQSGSPASLSPTRVYLQHLKHLSQMSRFLFLMVAIVMAFSMHPRFPTYVADNKQDFSSLGLNISYYPQNISHFNFKPLGTFRQKYFVDTKYWNSTSKGPILFYCGNEGPIEMFYNNSGFYNEDVARNLSGMIVYMEHRYFGTSMPFGSQKEAYKKENLVYLTTEEATMDYVQFLTYLKATVCPDCPVIAFGGSYAGMLAVWMRMKYPHVVDMAHGASAPVFYFKNRKNLDYNVFYQIVTKNFQMHNLNCPSVIREGFRRLLRYYDSPSAPIALLSSYFNLCKPLKTHKNIENLIEYLENGYSFMAMLNYPYPTNFLKNIPAWPANSSCLPLDLVTPTSNDSALFSALRKSVEYYYSYNESKCNEIYEDTSSDQDMSGWNILACADEAMPISMSGTKDMFYDAPFDFRSYSNYCNSTYGIVPDYDFTLNFFGGRTDKELKSYSRIFFTNGDLDPWSGASPLQNISDTLVGCYIRYGAHHLDLRSPNPADPPNVVYCRNMLLSTLNKWLNQIKSEQAEAEVEMVL